MQDPANELRRIPLPRTPVNREGEAGRWNGKPRRERSACSASLSQEGEMQMVVMELELVVPKGMGLIVVSPAAYFTLPYHPLYDR